MFKLNFHFKAITLKPCAVLWNVNCTCITIKYMPEVKKSFYDNMPDQELLHKFHDGNNRYIGVLLERYTLLLFGVCIKYLRNEEDAKDAVQQIFLKVISELKKYKVEHFKSWLYMVARNHCLMHLREKSNFKISELDESLPLPQKNLETETVYEKEKLHSALEASLDELQEAQKTCLTLFYLNKKSYTEISGITGFNMMQVKSHIQNGKRNLKILVEKKLEKN